jgi:hypothetical protein
MSWTHGYYSTLTRNRENNIPLQLSFYSFYKVRLNESDIKRARKIVHGNSNQPTIRLCSGSEVGISSP